MLAARLNASIIIIINCYIIMYVYTFVYDSNKINISSNIHKNC